MANKEINNKRELLFSLTKKDFEVQTFRSGGKGGQHQNTTDSGVRIIHKASDARGESRSERSQHQNKKIAFRRLIESLKFQIWMKQIVHKLSSKQTPEEWVEEQMQLHNIQIEVRKDGKWQKI